MDSTLHELNGLGVPGCRIWCLFYCCSFLAQECRCRSCWCLPTLPKFQSVATPLHPRFSANLEPSRKVISCAFNSILSWNNILKGFLRVCFDNIASGIIPIIGSLLFSLQFQNYDYYSTCAHKTEEMIEKRHMCWRRGGGSDSGDGVSRVNTFASATKPESVWQVPVSDCSTNKYNHM